LETAIINAVGAIQVLIAAFHLWAAFVKYL
jgi:hypothetical protein